MTRPSLTPMTYCEFDRPKEKPLRRLVRNLRRLVRDGVRAVARGVVRVVATDLSAGGLRKTLPIRVVAIGILMKLVWLPPAVVVACGLAVYRQTSGPRPAMAQVARVSNAFSERVALHSADGVELSAVWIPAISPADIVGRGEDVLTRREAAVVLVPDHEQDASQLLAQATLLHEIGLHVLVLDPRGTGHSEEASRTFGRKERLDVAAAVNYLAARASVDKARIAVWAMGTGALAAEHAPSGTPIALLLAQPVSAETEGVDDRFVPAHPAYDPLRPVCRWLFHVLYAGGAADTVVSKPGRTVELPPGELDPAMAELRSFASEHLVARGR